MVAVEIDRLDESGAPPIARDHDDHPIPEPPSAPRDSIQTPETRDQKTYDAEFRRAVDAEYGTERELLETAPDRWHGDDGCSLNSGESADQETYAAHYRALVEAEYRDVRWSSGTDLPTLGQIVRRDFFMPMLIRYARSVPRLRHTRPSFRQPWRGSMTRALKSTGGPAQCPTHPVP